MSQSSLQIAVSGGGIAGLAAAAFLARQGHAVTVYERNQTLRPTGAGLLLQPSGLAVLEVLGAKDDIVSRSARVSGLNGQTTAGKPLFDIRYADAQRDAYGLGVHRGTLFEALRNKAQEADVRFVLGREVVSSQLVGPEKRILSFADGSTSPAYDLVIDGSGYRSPLRAEASIARNQPYPYGALWAVCEDTRTLPDTVVLEQRFKGTEVMIGVMPIGKRPGSDKNHIALFWNIPVDGYAQWKASDFGQWKQEVASYWPEVQPYLDQLNSHADMTFAVYGDVMLNRYHAPGLAFVGDAAHSTSPQLGQGANLGLVDAYTLAACIAEHGQIEDALKAYSAARKKHIHFYQFASRSITPFFQAAGTRKGQLRDALFPVMNKVPGARAQMAKTLIGNRTGVFTSLKKKY